MKKFFAAIFALSVAFLMSGCTASYQGDFLRPQVAMQAHTRILIVTPEMGHFEDIDYPGSGNEVASALAKEMQTYSNEIAVIPTPVKITDIHDVDLERSDYVFIPEILHWEDRATGWSFRPDRIEIRFDIYNKQRELVNSYLVTGRSAYVVWVSKQPNSLLKAPIREMLETFFNK